MRIVFFPMLLLSAFLSGCATFRNSADYPVENELAEVAVVSKAETLVFPWNNQTFYDAERQISIFPNTYRGSPIHDYAPFSLLSFAVRISELSARDRFKTAIGNIGTATKDSVDIGTLLREQLTASLAAKRAPRWQQAIGDGTLQLSPQVHFKIDQESGKARLYAVLRAEVPGSNGLPSWSVRYFARSPGEYNFEGNDSWMEQDRIASNIQIALSRVLEACIKHTHGNFTEAKAIRLRVPLPFVSDEHTWPFVAIQESDDTIIAKLLIDDPVPMSGIYVLDRSDFREQK